MLPRMFLDAPPVFIKTNFDLYIFKRFLSRWFIGKYGHLLQPEQAVALRGDEWPEQDLPLQPHSLGPLHWSPRRRGHRRHHCRRGRHEKEEFFLLIIIIIYCIFNHFKLYLIIQYMYLLHFIHRDKY